MITAHLRSVGDGRTPTGETGHQIARAGPGVRSVAVALVTPRHAPVLIAVPAGVRPGPSWSRRSVSDGRSAVPAVSPWQERRPAKRLAAVPPCVAARAGWDAAGGGADRRSAKNAAAPVPEGGRILGAGGEAQV